MRYVSLIRFKNCKLLVLIRNNRMIFSIKAEKNHPQITICNAPIDFSSSSDRVFCHGRGSSVHPASELSCIVVK